MNVAALYVDPRGPYPAMLGADACWDEKRDARNYDGPHPVVAHPPCGPWSALAHLSHGKGRDCAPRALAQVRRFGGVLEHPAHSRFFVCKGLLPGTEDTWGFTVKVAQVSWGHVARKPTWLYCVGIDRDLVLRTMRTGGTPTHWTSGGRTPSSRKGSPVPPGIKVCSAQQRRRTPPEFAKWLVGLAATARTPGAGR